MFDYDGYIFKNMYSYQLTKIKMILIFIGTRHASKILGRYKKIINLNKTNCKKCFGLRSFFSITDELCKSIFVNFYKFINIIVVLINL